MDLDVVREQNIFEGMVENLGLRGKAIFYKCPKCNHEFTGGPGIIRCHFLPPLKGRKDFGIRAKECTASKKPTSAVNRVREIQVIFDFRASSMAAAGAKRSREAAPFQPSQAGGIMHAFGVQGNKSVEILLVEMIADCDLSPNLLRRQSFRSFIKSMQEAGVSYSLPYPVSVGLNGSLLNNALNEMKEERSRSMRGIDIIGGTIVSNGAKNLKRALLNTALQLSNGSIFIQSTDATGVACKTAEYLLSDIENVRSCQFYSFTHLNSLDHLSKFPLDVGYGCNW